MEWEGKAKMNLVLLMWDERYQSKLLNKYIKSMFLLTYLSIVFFKRIQLQLQPSRNKRIEQSYLDFQNHSSLKETRIFGEIGDSKAVAMRIK